MDWLLLHSRYATNLTKLEPMVTTQDTHVYLEAMEAAKDKGEEPAKAGHIRKASLSMGEFPVGLLADSR